MQVKTKLVFFPLLFSYPPFKIMPSWLPYGPAVIVSFLRKHNCNVVLEDLYYKIQKNNAKYRLFPSKKINLWLLLYEDKLLSYLEGKEAKVDSFAERITNIAFRDDFNLVGFSVITYMDFVFSLVLTKKIKTQKSIIVVLGGPFITKYKEDLFKRFSFLHRVNVDYMISGEGQIPMLRLIKYLEGADEINNVPGLIYKDKGLIKSNPYVYFPFNDVPVPDFSDLDLDFYRMSLEEGRDEILILPYQVTRGCIFNCTFCGGRRILSKSYETKSYEKIINDIKYMKNKYKSSHFLFRDDSINCSYDFLDGLCEKFIENKLDIKWITNGIRPDNLDRRILRKMKKAGCYIMNFGIESGSNRILKMMGKNFTIDETERVLKNSYREGLKNCVNIMVGYPYEKEDDIRMTVDFIRNNASYINKINFVARLQVQYGSALYEHPDRFGIKLFDNACGYGYRMGVRYYPFDEVSGLKWSQKKKQTDKFRRIIMQAEFKYIIMKKYKFIMPFMAVIYFFFRDHYIFSGRLLIKLFYRVVRLLAKE